MGTIRPLQSEPDDLACHRLTNDSTKCIETNFVLPVVFSFVSHLVLFLSGVVHVRNMTIRNFNEFFSAKNPPAARMTNLYISCTIYD